MQASPTRLSSLAAAPVPWPAGVQGVVWSYDNIGNRLTNRVNETTQTYTYQKVGANPLNWQRLLNDGVNAHTYDNNGNTQTRNGPGGNFTFGWNTDDNLTGISGAGTASYKYDYAGRRSSKTVGATTSFLYDGRNLIGETGASTADYLFGPGVDEPLAMVRDGQAYNYVVDDLGSANAMTDVAGAVQATYLYDAWGVVRNQTGSLSNPFGYTAREFAEAGLWYYRFRYYQPMSGRLFSEDALSKKLHAFTNDIYRYGYNSPVMFTDPLGLMPSGCVQHISKGGAGEPLNSLIWKTAWYEIPGRSPTEGNEQQPPQSQVEPPRGIRPPPGRPGRGVPYQLTPCWFERKIMETTTWRFDAWIVTCCECPPGCSPPMHTFVLENTIREIGKEQLQYGSRPHWGIFGLPCPRPPA